MSAHSDTEDRVVFIIGNSSSNDDVEPDESNESFHRSRSRSPAHHGKGPTSSIRATGERGSRAGLQQQQQGMSINSGVDYGFSVWKRKRDPFYVPPEDPEMEEMVFYSTPTEAFVSVGYPNAQNPVAAYGGWLEAEYNEATGELLRPPKGSFPELEEEEEKRELKAKERERNRLAQQEYRKRAKTFSCKFYIGGNTYCLDDDCC